VTIFYVIVIEFKSFLTTYIYRIPGRTAGDVLNDIGSMLADLTDELDAMLQLERKDIII
jgi:hypothetical protein